MFRRFRVAFALALSCASAFASAFADVPHASDTTDADRAFFAGNLDRAQELYRMVTAESSDYAIALRQLGKIALYENHLDDAEHDANLAAAHSMGDKSAYVLLAEIAARRGTLSAAKAFLELAGRPESAEAFAGFPQSALSYRPASPYLIAHIPFVQTDPLPAVEARVNGLTGLFLIDTGAAEIVLDPAFANRAGVAGGAGATGTFAGGRTASLLHGRIVSFALGPLEVSDVRAVLLTTAGFSAAAGGKSVAGVIGTEFLSRFRTTLDYPGHALILAPPDAPPTEAAPLASIPFLLVRDHFILARGAFDGGPQQMFFVDSGLAGFAFTAPASTLAAAGIALPVVAAQNPALPGQSAATPFGINSLSLGSLHRENLQGLYGPFPPSLESSTGIHIAGIVSHAFFRPFAVTFDFQRMAIEIRKPST
jgi:hypothetical protein